MCRTQLLTISHSVILASSTCSGENRDTLCQIFCVSSISGMTVQGFVPSVTGLPSPASCTSSASAFTGKAVHPVRPPPAKQNTSRSAVVHMKKNRFHQSMRPQQQQQMQLPEDGTPVFGIFVRTTRAKIWYPLGGVTGDGKAKGLVNAMKGGFAKSMYVNALDKGMAATVYGKDNGRYVQNALRMYPQLKKYTKDLEFGYKVTAVDLEEQPTKLLTREMAMSFGAWAKKKMDNVFKGSA